MIRLLIRPRWTLRRRLVVIFSAIISLVLVAQTLFSLSGDVTNLDSRITTQGTLLAQSVATSSAGHMDLEDPHRFDGLVDRVRRKVDLVEIAIVDEDGRVLGHSDPSRIGEPDYAPEGGLFGAHRSKPGVLSVFTGEETEYRTSAPVLKGTNVLGFVHLRFRSNEVAESARRLLLSVAAMTLVWLALAAGIASVYVGRITRGLANLTEAALVVSRGGLAEVEIAKPTAQDEVGVLQATFGQLVESLRAHQAENARLLAEQRDTNVRLRQRVDEVTADLRATTAYLESVIQCIEEGVITSTGEGTIVRANRGAFRQLEGLGRPEPGTRVGDIVPDGAPLDEAVRSAILEGTTRQVELVRSPATRRPRTERMRRSSDSSLDGPEARTIVFRVYPLRGVEGPPLGAVTTVLDATDERRAEARLRRQDRLASLGTIAAALAHELGNYMHAINGFSAVLAASFAPDDPRRSDAQAIHDENARAVELLERFLQFARPSKPMFAPQPVDSLVREALEICSSRLRDARVEVKEELATEGHEVECDGPLLTQVFVNLVLNAADAMEARATRTLLIRSRVVGGGRVEVEFADTGTGILPEHIEKVFNPFFTTKAAKGTGLGLSIAHEIVSRHSGSITVESEPGVGTEFIVVLPGSGKSP